MSSERLARIRLHGDVPGHVAVIMDGNGRWAAERGLPRHLGHREGMKAVRETISGAVEAGIDILTLFATACDVANFRWRRSNPETISIARRRDVARLDALMAQAHAHTPSGIPSSVRNTSTSGV